MQCRFISGRFKRIDVVHVLTLSVVLGMMTVVSLISRPLFALWSNRGENSCHDSVHCQNIHCFSIDPCIPFLVSLIFERLFVELIHPIMICLTIVRML